MGRWKTIRRVATGSLVAAVLLGNGALGARASRPMTARTATRVVVIPHTRSAAPALGSNDDTGRTIYQIVTDRFYNGDTTNDNPASSPNLNSPDHSNWWYYWGGDWAGVAAKMPYLSSMGVGAIWISPGVENTNVPVPINGQNQAGYHGYWGMDYYQPEPHFGSFSDFDTMVQTAHNYGIQVILDFAPNQTSPANAGQPSYAKDGALYKNGVQLASFNNDPNGYFHHNGSITDYENFYQVQYESLANLADFAQENSSVDQYLRGAISTWLGHGIDGIRMDAVKLIPEGWMKAFNDGIYAQGNTFMFGEWYDGSSAGLWPQEVKFANTSGMSVENFDLNGAVRDVFANGNSMTELDSTISRDAAAFTYPNQQVTFVDNQDLPRFLSVNNNQALLNDATTFVMTTQGIPSIYYGDEQYLHNDTNGGADPYNRPMMASWNQTTTGYKLIHTLATLRQQSPAIQFGSSGQRYLTSDVYIFERRFYNDVALIAINKSTSTGYNISGLNTALPAGSYGDVLNGLLGGQTITVGSGSGGNNPVTPFTLGPNQAAVWSYSAPTPTTPEVGNIGPVMGRAGDKVTITGKGFGTTTGTVKFAGATATVTSWTNTAIQVTVPAGAPAGGGQVTVTTGGGTSNGILYNVLSGPQVAVTFQVDNAHATNYGDNIYLTGNVPELGSWTTNTATNIGPLVDPSNPTWFGMASVPASTNLQFKFIDELSGGGYIWENGNNHTYASPSSGDGRVEVGWQY